MTTEGKPYKPEKYNSIIRDEVYITEMTSLTLADVDNMAIQERSMWIRNIVDLEKKKSENLKAHRELAKYKNK